MEEEHLEEQYSSLADYLKKVGLKIPPMKSQHQRRTDNHNARTDRRDKILASHRLISGSPIPPTPQNRIGEDDGKLEGKKEKKPMDPRVQKRMDQLKKWREERDRRRALEKANQKPIFKSACHIDRTTNIYLTASRCPQKFTLADKNHKFKAPANVKPIAFNNQSEKADVPSKTEKEDENSDQPIRRKLFTVETAKKGESKNVKDGKEKEKTSMRTRSTKTSENASKEQNTRVTRQNKKVGDEQTVTISKNPNKREAKLKVKEEPIQSDKTESAKSKGSKLNLERKKHINIIQSPPKTKGAIKKQLSSATTSRITRSNSVAAMGANVVKTMDLIGKRGAIEPIKDSSEQGPEETVCKTPAKTPKFLKFVRILPENELFAVNEPIKESEEQDPKETVCKTPAKTPKVRKSVRKTPHKEPSSVNEENVINVLDLDDKHHVIDPIRGSEDQGPEIVCKTPTKTPKARKSFVKTPHKELATVNEEKIIKSLDLDDKCYAIEPIRESKDQGPEIVCKTPAKTPKVRKFVRKTPHKEPSSVNEENVINALDLDDKLHPIQSIKESEEQDPREIVCKTPAKTPKSRKPIKIINTPKKEKSTVDQENRIKTVNKSEDEASTCEHNPTTSVSSTESGLSSVYSMNDNVFNSSINTSEDEKFKTPIKNDDQQMIVYVSPFVTMSRGKNSARKEFKSRNLKGGHSLVSPQATSVNAGGQYFYKLLDDEILRIRELCDRWEQYQKADSVPEEAFDMINVAIGQSNLLISRKMGQFRQLINKSVQGVEGPVITCTDLHGFWDMIMIQVANLDKRYANLDNLRANNWEEIIPEKRKTPIVKPKKRIMPKRAAKEAKSSIRAAIKAARAHKKFMPVEETEFNGGFFSIKSPVKENVGNASRKTPRKSTTLLRTVLSGEVRKSIKTSPGLVMLNATQTAHNACVVEVTPKKSILKVATPISSVKKQKAVLFKKNEAEIHPYVLDYNVHNDENDFNIENVQVSSEICPQKDAPNVTPRRSIRTRLSKMDEFALHKTF